MELTNRGIIFEQEASKQQRSRAGTWGYPQWHRRLWFSFEKQDSLTSDNIDFQNKGRIVRLAWTKYIERFWLSASRIHWLPNRKFRNLLDQLGNVSNSVACSNLVCRDENWNNAPIVRNGWLCVLFVVCHIPNFHTLVYSIRILGQWTLKNSEKLQDRRWVTGANDKKVVSYLRIPFTIFDHHLQL